MHCKARNGEKMKLRIGNTCSWIGSKLLLSLILMATSNQAIAQSSASLPNGSEIKEFLGTYTSISYSLGNSSRHVKAEIRFYELTDGYADGYFIDFKFPCQSNSTFDRYAFNPVTGKMTLLQIGTGNCATAENIQLKFYVNQGSEVSPMFDVTRKIILDVEIGLTSPVVPEGYLHLNQE